MGLWLTVALMALKFGYHRWREYEEGPKRAEPRRRQEVPIPRTDEGSPVPLVFGRCRVRAPLLVWSGDLQYHDQPMSTANEIGPYRVYALDMLFVVGIPMGSGVGRGGSLGGPKLHNVWFGDEKLPGGELPSVSGVTTYYGQSVLRDRKYGGPGRGGGLHGAYYWFGGWKDQSFLSPASRIGDRMTAWGATRIPGLKRQMCVALNRMPEDSSDSYWNMTRADPAPTVDLGVWPTHGFAFGESPSIPAPSFEVSTYGDVVSGASGHVFSMTQAGVDFGGGADPAEVIYCVMTDPLGKLNIDPSRIDTASFLAASTTLKSEGHGYSRAWEESVEATEIIEDVLAQIDAALDENPVTGKWRLKLIRPDYDPATIPHITRNNCETLLSFSMSGHSGLINTVRVVYEDKDDEYKEKSAIAKNPANAVGQDGQINEAVLNMGGVKSAVLAHGIAGRELAARSVPIIKFRADVGREFLRVQTGDAVKVTWTNPDISGLVFRVANVERGMLENGKITLDLISDVFYVWRNQPPKRPDVGVPNAPTEANVGG